MEEGLSSRRLVIGAAGALFLGGLVLAMYTVRRVQPAALTIGQTTLTLREYEHPDDRAALALHETIHRMQYRRVGMLPFVTLYVLDRQQRLAWEAEARLAAVCLIRGRDRRIAPRALDMAAEGLTRYWVVRPVSTTEARAYIRRAYDQGLGCSRPVIARAVAAASDRMKPRTIHFEGPVLGE